MHQLRIHTQRLSDVDIVYLEGAVESTSFDVLSAIVSKLIEEGNPRIVLECRQLSYVGSVELKELIDFARLARARDGDIKCVGLAPTIEQVATLVSCGDPMDCFEDVPSALSAFRGTPTHARG